MRRSGWAPVVSHTVAALLVWAGAALLPTPGAPEVGNGTTEAALETSASVYHAVPTHVSPSPTSSASLELPAFRPGRRLVRAPRPTNALRAASGSATPPSRRRLPSGFVPDRNTAPPTMP